MKHTCTVHSLLVLALAAGPTAPGSTPGRPSAGTPQSPPALTAGCERLLKSIEKNITEAAEAMPEERFNFTPDSLHIQGSAYEGVRTFAGQVKHLATDNFAIWSPLTGDPLPAGAKDVNGPEELKSKAEIIGYLKESFALGHRAIATLTAENALEMVPFRGRKLPRLDLVFFALTHANDHYGQMVVYLRMCGIIPPASHPRTGMANWKSAKWMASLKVCLPESLIGPQDMPSETAKQSMAKATAIPRTKIKFTNSPR